MNIDIPINQITWTSRPILTKAQTTKTNSTRNTKPEQTYNNKRNLISNQNIMHKKVQAWTISGLVDSA